MSGLILVSSVEGCCSQPEALPPAGLGGAFDALRALALAPPWRETSRPVQWRRSSVR